MGSGLEKKKEMEYPDWSWAGPRLPHRYVVADSAISVTTDQDRYLTYLSDRSHWAEAQVGGKSFRMIAFSTGIESTLQTTAGGTAGTLGES